jgi:hypothetical protein
MDIILDANIASVVMHLMTEPTFINRNYQFINYFYIT